jgi:hypothetical protein
MEVLGSPSRWFLREERWGKRETVKGYVLFRGVIPAKLDSPVSETRQSGFSWIDRSTL